MKVTAIKINPAWQAEDDLALIMRAKELKKDKKRMAAVKKLAQEKLGELAKLADIGSEDDD